jgi:hypothetical protein
MGGAVVVVFAGVSAALAAPAQMTPVNTARVAVSRNECCIVPSKDDLQRLKVTRAFNILAFLAVNGQRAAGYTTNRPAQRS